MSRGISKTKLRAFAFTLRAEGMDACVKAHAQPAHLGNLIAALRERGEIKKAIAIRLESIIDGNSDDQRPDPS